MSAVRTSFSRLSSLSRRPSLPPASRACLPGLYAGQTRLYKGPARDVMTGEIIQLPDIDVSSVWVVGEAPSAADQEKSSLVKIQHTEAPKRRPASSKLIFGHTFTDHMLTIPWNSASGWGNPDIKPCKQARRRRSDSSKAYFYRRTIEPGPLLHGLPLCFHTVSGSSIAVVYKLPRSH